MSEVKELLTKLKNLFNAEEKPQEELQDIVALETDVVDEEVLVEEVKTEEVELAEEPVEEAPKEAPVQVEYATKLELQELQKTILELIEKITPLMDTKREVPQELSVEEKVEEITHSPELEVEKKISFNGNKNANSIQSRIYNTLFS